MLKLFKLFPVIYLFIFSCTYNKSNVYLLDENRLLTDSTLTVLYVPTDNLSVDYINKVTMKSDSSFSDSFFIDAVNKFIPFVVNKNFAKCIIAPSNIATNISNINYSKLAGDTANIKEISSFIEDLSKQIDFDILLFPYSITMKNTTYQIQTWHGGGPSYKHPISYNSTTKLHIQIWSKNGKLLFEKVGYSSIKKPAMYSLLKRKQKSNEDLTRFAERLYSPPLIRTLYSATKDALKIKKLF